MSILPIYIGYDGRQPVSFTTLTTSILRHTRSPVAITPLVLSTLGTTRQGLTPFTYTRFLVPYLQGYEDWALFMDVDVMVRDDLTKVFDFADDSKAIMVVKNRKRFEWASVMLMNCARLTMLTREFVETRNDLHTLEFLQEDDVGELPAEFNHLVGYDPPNPNAKIVHFTQGVPAFPETEGCEFSNEWKSLQRMSNATAPWLQLMGNSVHAYQQSDGSVVPRLKAGVDNA